LRSSLGASAGRSPDDNQRHILRGPVAIFARREGRAKIGRVEASQVDTTAVAILARRERRAQLAGARSDAAAGMMLRSSLGARAGRSVTRVRSSSGPGIVVAILAGMRAERSFDGSRCGRIGRGCDPRWA
jgi:hypothetical protein